MIRPLEINTPILVLIVATPTFPSLPILKSIIIPKDDCNGDKLYSIRTQSSVFKFGTSAVDLLQAAAVILNTLVFSSCVLVAKFVAIFKVYLFKAVHTWPIKE